MLYRVKYYDRENQGVIASTNVEGDAVSTNQGLVTIRRRLPRKNDDVLTSYDDVYVQRAEDLYQIAEIVPERS